MTSAWNCLILLNMAGISGRGGKAYSSPVAIGSEEHPHPLLLGRQTAPGEADLVKNPAVWEFSLVVKGSRIGVPNRLAIREKTLSV